jgi:hypothetical protein
MTMTTTMGIRPTTARLLLACALLCMAGPGCAEDQAGPASESATAPASVTAVASAPVTAPATAPVTASAPATAFAELLSKIVTDEGLVRYDVLDQPANSAALAQYVQTLADAPLPGDQAERLAFWCNAYNANVLRNASLARKQPGFVSVEKVKGFFDESPIVVANEALTLNDLENKRIRPLGDARIHAALVCAARSCPPLRAEPYRAADLDTQLDDQCKRWVNDTTKFRLEGGKLGLSEILKWYGEDFETPRYGTRVGFVLAYADPGREVARFIAGELTADRKVATTWIPYDWTLNDAAKGPGATR